MKIRILQGANLINPITTIIIGTDSTPRTEHIEEVKNLHPVFMDSYKVDKDSIYIQSKLPHFWKEVAIAVNNYSKGEWTYDLTRSYIFEKVIGTQISTMSTIPVLKAAHELGYETTQYFIEEGLTPEGVLKKFNRYYVIGVGQEGETTVSLASSKDSNLGMMVQRDKWLTNIMLNRLKLPIADWELIESRQDLEDLHKKYDKPYVIKPVGLTGGGGVTTNITTLEQAYTAYETAQKAINLKERKEWQKKIMIQTQVTGDDYRLLVINGKLEIATKRIPAYVVGDGESTIENLINEINEDPRRNKQNPTHTLKPIVFDEMLTEFLNEQGLTVKDVLSKGKKVYVRKVASMSQGGITEDFTEKVHPQIKYVVETLAQSLHTYVLGVDVICNSISEPLDGKNGSIIECNTMPESYLNAFPVIGKQYPQIGHIVIQGLVGGKPKTKKLVYIGKDVGKLDTFIKLKTSSKDETVGVYTNGEIKINGTVIAKNVETWRAIEAMKLNTSLTSIVIHYNDLEEVEKVGVGFDYTDNIAVSNDLENDRRFDTLRGLVSMGVVAKVETI